MTAVAITKFLSNVSSSRSHSGCHIFFEVKGVFSVKCGLFLQKPQLYIGTVDIRLCLVETSQYVATNRIHCHSFPNKILIKEMTSDHLKFCVRVCVCVCVCVYRNVLGKRRSVMLQLPISTINQLSFNMGANKLPLTGRQ